MLIFLSLSYGVDGGAYPILIIFWLSFPESEELKCNDTLPGYALTPSLNESSLT
jgi:hypothetical protein